MASIDGQQGILEFPFGLCRIVVDDSGMRIRVQLEDSSNVDKAEKVIADHLIRMANKDDPVIEWVRHDLVTNGIQLESEDTK